jgi:hypothetical protein
VPVMQFLLLVKPGAEQRLAPRGVKKRIA